MSHVTCMVEKGAEITVEKCIIAQVEERCFCMKALAALKEIGDGDSKTSLKDRANLVTLRGRAAGMYRQPPERRYAGPALRVYNEQIQGSKLADGTGPGATLVESPAQRESPAGTNGVVPAVADTGLLPRVCSVPGCTIPLGKKSAHDKCHRCRERALRQSVARTRFCKAEGCKTQLRAPNYSDYCSICRARLEHHQGEPVPEIKPVALKVLPGVVDAAVDLSRKAFNDALGKVLDSPVKYGEPPLRDPESLPHEYLVACVKEARRRLAALDEHFTFITAKEA